MPANPAASLIIVREVPASAHGTLQVLLMERHASASNFPGALVFPGGKVEAGDAAIAAASGFDRHWQALAPRLAGHGLTREAMAALYGAALRETAEEAGLLWLEPDAPRPAQSFQPSQSRPNQPALLPLLRRQLASGGDWCQICAQWQLHTSVQGMEPFSRWITPLSPNMSVKRFDTWFFLALMPEGQQARADGQEAQRLVWASPAALLQQYVAGEVALAPPQIMTLAHLARFASLQNLQQHAREQAPHLVAPVSLQHEGERMVCFPGDALHPQPVAAMPGPTRLVLRDGRFVPPGGWETLLDG
ncbi:NUDIX hydrolase [Corticibacter populi]|uniref:NUDIX hydrolase n=1 Tax=Corticibacter populi TaxID=1550736 RepID=UPI0013EE6628|nr:NUDIX hydrolase [Corticibacter populi]